jgi:nitrogen fixation/metabolism regulation signal transduction histidine kinase
VKHERQLLLLALLAGLPGALVALILLWTGDFTPKVQWTLTVFILGGWWVIAFMLQERATRPLQTLSNMLAALHEGDFSMRARRANVDDALGLALLEANALGETLRRQRLGAVEATALLRTVMSEIEVAVFAFDGEHVLRLVNRGGERLLGQPAERILGLPADALRVGQFLEGETHGVADLTFPGGTGRWDWRRSTFRQDGLTHYLLVMSDLSRALREEERTAWQRLIRVLSHEINNSLAPIKSIAGNLKEQMARGERRPDAERDTAAGLAVIASRAEALSRFMASYARLARLPRPKLQPLEVRAWVQRVTALETRMKVSVVGGPDRSISADGDQLDQMLINLVGNAVDAATETGGGVRVGWKAANGQMEVWVEDEGPGLPDTANLFVPFFTTKPQGSGIGLVLSRQIAEAHGGSLVLANRRDAKGCVARFVMPV